MEMVMEREEQNVQRRKYNVGGCFSVIGCLVAKADRQNPEQPISLLQSWLPLSSHKMEKNPTTTYREPGVIPALPDRSFRRLAPSIDAYANERGWVVQPVSYFYRPTILDKILGEDGKIKDLPAAMRDASSKERILIDSTIQTESQPILRDVLQICLNAIDEANIYEPEYAQANVHPRIVINQLLTEMPFLVHHIFKHLPNLRVLRHRARVNGRDDTIYHIRYSPEALQDMDVNRMMRPHVINVAP